MNLLFIFSVPSKPNLQYLTNEAEVNFRKAGDTRLPPFMLLAKLCAQLSVPRRDTASVDIDTEAPSQQHSCYTVETQPFHSCCVDVVRLFICIIKSSSGH